MSFIRLEAPGSSFLLVCFNMYGFLLIKKKFLLGIRLSQKLVVTYNLVMILVMRDTGLVRMTRVTRD